jgi:DNA topoisomerase III
VRELNYLEVYFPYEKWSNNSIPNYVEGESFIPTSVLLSNGVTQPAQYLSEADLLDLM